MMNGLIKNITERFITSCSPIFIWKCSIEKMYCWSLAVEYVFVHWFMMVVKLLTTTMSEMSCSVILLAICQPTVYFQHTLKFELVSFLEFLKSVSLCFQVELLWNQNVDLIPNVYMMCIVVYAAVGHSWAPPTLSIKSKWPQWEWG